jgi:hypothetical protein
MDSPEAKTHVFIVRIWADDPSPESGPAVWSGYITHAPDGERRRLQDLDSIPAFIAPYLEEFGVRPGPAARLRRLLSQWRRRR